MGRTVRRSATPWLALLAIFQIAASSGVLVAITAVNTAAAACDHAAIIPPRAPGHAAYLDVQALIRVGGANCAEASTPAAVDLMAPFAAQALARRELRAAADPAYTQRIDPALNQGRINFLLFGYGETYEPPFEPDFKGSINIFSLDTATLNVSTITLNHDIRAPEVERYRQGTDQKQGPTRIDQSYPVGGFDIMRLAVEDATGLSVDYQLVVNDGVIKDAVDELFGGLPVDVPFEFEAMPISFNSTMYPARHYAAGRQVMDGLEAIQFVKALNGGTYDRSEELAVRKQVVVQALSAAARRETANPLFWTKAIGFLQGAVERKTVAYDFDPLAMLRAGIQPSVARGLLGQISLPTFEGSTYIVDERSGDGGVEWVTASANPIFQHELEAGFYIDRSFAVPLAGADPSAPNLATDYWPSVRQLVRERLSRGQ